MILRSVFASILVGIGATAIYIANTAEYAECSHTRAVTYHDELRPNLSEQFDTLVSCQQGVLGIGNAEAGTLIAFLAVFFGMGILLKIGRSRSRVVGSVTSLAAEKSQNLFANNQREKTADMSNPPSIIGPSVLIQGALQSNGDVRIEGSMEGDIHCASLIIADTGQVQGDILAERVVIQGRFSGTLHAHEVVLCAGSQVEGVIWQKSLQIESGARFTGDCRHSENPQMRLASGNRFLPQEKTLMNSAEFTAE